MDDFNQNLGDSKIYNDEKKDRASKTSSLKEEVTEYQEFVPSFNDWITPDEQADRAEELENMTEND
ncbi:MAG: hypothetical protein LBJ09_03130 [Clostridiales bacterium]|nr:hypothetical protein [Clostridiales bacterium]